MKGETLARDHIVKLLRDLQKQKNWGLTEMANALGTEKNRLKYLLELDKDERGKRIFDFLRVLFRARKARRENLTVFYKRLESEIGYEDDQRGPRGKYGHVR